MNYSPWFNLWERLQFVGIPRMDCTRHRWRRVFLSGPLSGLSPGSVGTLESTYWSFGQLWRGHSKFFFLLPDASALHYWNYVQCVRHSLVDLLPGKIAMVEVFILKIKFPSQYLPQSVWCFNTSGSYDRSLGWTVGCPVGPRRGGPQRIYRNTFSRTD